MKEQDIRLNPFVYISETDIRFYLLIVISIIAPVYYALPPIAGIGTLIPVDSYIIFLIAIIIIACLILGLTYGIYRGYPNKIISKWKLKQFRQEKSPELWEYVENVFERNLPSPRKPILLYQPLDPTTSAFTFGRKNHNYIGMSGKLLTMFFEKMATFKSIFLHELGHISNKDVEKAYLAASVWRTLCYLLFIPCGIILLMIILSNIAIFLLAIVFGMDLGSTITEMNLLRDILALTILLLNILLFAIIVYVLRNQIIRTREFYADAKVLEWEKSPWEICETLEEFKGNQHSRFELLWRYHPNINERIRALKSNLLLFKPSLWLAFSIGFFYNIIEQYPTMIKAILVFGPEGISEMGEEVGFRAIVSFIILPLLMLAVGSSFHKAALKSLFIDKRSYFSGSMIIVTLAFIAAFVLGTLSLFLIEFILTVAVNAIYQSTFIELGGSIPEIFNIIVNFAMYQAIYFFISLFFIIIFSSMFIQRSFSRKEAMYNYLIISVISAMLYIVNRYLIIETLHTWPLLILSLAVFTAFTYIYIKIKDRKLCCPECGHRIMAPSETRTDCPKCHNSLYPWAVYDFS